jgi:hypothetical protein
MTASLTKVVPKAGSTTGQPVVVSSTHGRFPSERRKVL